MGSGQGGPGLNGNRSGGKHAKSRQADQKPLGKNEIQRLQGQKLYVKFNIIGRN